MNDNELFGLARYTHNTLAPLFAEVKAIEPTLLTAIEMQFATKDSVHHQSNRIGVSAWWGRDDMFLLSNNLRTKADIDKLAIKIKDDIEDLHRKATLQPAPVSV